MENGTIRASEQHVEKILKPGPQTTKKGVRALLGLINYHRDVIPGLSDIIFCLTELLKRNQSEKNMKWQEKHTQALDKVKAI